MSLRSRLRRRSFTEFIPIASAASSTSRSQRYDDVRAAGAAIGRGRRRVGEDQKMLSVHRGDVVEARRRTGRRRDRVDQRARARAEGAEIDQPLDAQRQEFSLRRRAQARRSDRRRARDDRRTSSPIGCRSISPAGRCAWPPASRPGIPDRFRCGRRTRRRHRPSGSEISPAPRPVICASAALRSPVPWVGTQSSNCSFAAS